HGLCSEHVILPGEKKEEFEAVTTALFDEWQPITFTRALLVERLAVTFWKLQRAVRVERAWHHDPAEDAGIEVDRRASAVVEGGMNLLDRFPDQALHTLRSLSPGLDHLIGMWEALASAVDSGWNSRESH